VLPVPLAPGGNHAADPGPGGGGEQAQQQQ
jgi:hypothetical protein